MLYIGEAHLTGDPLHGVLMLSAGSCADCMSLFYLVITGAPARATLLGVAFVLALAGMLFFFLTRAGACLAVLVARCRFACVCYKGTRDV